MTLVVSTMGILRALPIFARAFALLMIISFGGFVAIVIVPTW